MDEATKAAILAQADAIRGGTPNPSPEPPTQQSFPLQQTQGVAPANVPPPTPQQAQPLTQTVQPDPVRQAILQMTGGQTDDPDEVAKFLQYAQPILQSMAQVAKEKEQADALTEDKKQLIKEITNRVVGAGDVPTALANVLELGEQRALARLQAQQQFQQAQGQQMHQAVVSKREQFFRDNPTLETIRPVVEQAVLEGTPPGVIARMAANQGAEAVVKYVLGKDASIPGQPPQPMQAQMNPALLPYLNIQPPVGGSTEVLQRQEKTAQNFEQKISAAKSSEELDAVWAEMEAAAAKGWQ